MVAPKEGGRIQVVATDLVSPRVNGCALDAGAPVAFERSAKPSRISLAAIQPDGGLSKLDDGADIESAAASRTWFAFTRGKGEMRARDRSGGPAFDESSTRSVLGLTNDILVTATTADAVLLRRLSIEDDGTGTNVVKATKLAEHPLASVTSAVIDDENAYLATASAYVEAALLDGGALRRVASSTGKIIAMAVDDSDLYVAATDGIMKIEKRSYQTVRRYPVVAAGIALDERFVYFTNPVLGTVTRAPR
jgi:hypothetical protein